MLHTFFRNMTLMISLVFITIKIKEFLVTNKNKRFLFLTSLAFINGLMAFLVMLTPIKIGGMLYDLRMVPLFISSYLGGWQPGLLTAIPLFGYRLYLGGPFVLNGIINGLVIIVVGSYFNQDIEDPNEPFALKKPIIIFALINTIILGAYLFGLDVEILFGLRIGLGLLVFSIISLASILLMINDANRQYTLKNKLKEQKIELKSEKEKLQKYLKVSPVIFMILDRDKEISLINNKGCQLFGYNQEEVLGKNFFEDFLSKDDRFRFEKLFEDMITDRHELVEQFECPIVDREGNVKNIVWTNTLLRDKHGKIEAMLTSGLDITEQKFLQSELDYNELQTEFFANLSHELRTPLNLIYSALQILKSSPKPNNQSQDQNLLGRYIDIIKVNVYRLLRLVDNIIDITKINSNHFNCKMEYCDIVGLMYEVIHSISEYIHNKDRKLFFDFKVKDKVIVCDPVQIKRIILNLLSNAIKFTEAGDEISVIMTESDNSINISIKDTGVGIPEDKQEIIFESFRQVDKSFRRHQEGSGLGLHIAKLLTELHNGKIRLNSKKDIGSEFIIQIPLDNRIDENQQNNYFREESINRAEIEFSDIYN